jgi:hypothetical protein
MKSKKEILKVYSFRVAASQIQLASFYGIDTGALFRKTLEQELSKKTGECVSCGQKVAGKKQRSDS